MMMKTIILSKTVNYVLLSYSFLLNNYLTQKVLGDWIFLEIHFDIRLGIQLKVSSITHLS